MHSFYKFIAFCDDPNLTTPYCLFPHSTHLLQPLVIAIFLPYQHWHTKAVDMALKADVPNSTRWSSWLRCRASECSHSGPTTSRLLGGRLEYYQGTQKLSLAYYRIHHLVEIHLVKGFQRLRNLFLSIYAEHNMHNQTHGQQASRPRTSPLSHPITTFHLGKSVPSGIGFTS